MSIDYEKLAKERLSSTKIYGYDQITAVSEASINFQLLAMYLTDESLRVWKATLETDDWVGIDADLGPSTIELQQGKCVIADLLNGSQALDR